MKVKWLIEETGNEWERLHSEVLKQGYECKSCSISDVFVKNNIFPENDCVIFHGSIMATRELKKHAKWIPLSWSSEEYYSCLNYYSYFGKYLFNDKYAFYPFNEILRLKEKIYSEFGKEDTIFIRPSSGAKLFVGGIVEKNDTTIWDSIQSCCEPNTLCVVSTPKNIKGEWRTFVLDKQIISYSQYRKDGKFFANRNLPDKARLFIDELLTVPFNTIDSLFTIDVCEDSDGNFWIMEIGAFSCSGLYDCDLEPVVRLASKLAEDEWKEYESKNI